MNSKPNRSSQLLVFLWSLAVVAGTLYSAESGFTIKVYHLGPLPLTATTDQGELIATKHIPNEHASEAKMIEWMKWNHAVVAGFLKKEGFEPAAGTFTVYDPEVGALAVRALPADHHSLEVLAFGLSGDREPNVREVHWEVDIVEVPFDTMIDTVRNGASADSTKMLEKLAEKGKIVKTLAGRGKFGSRLIAGSGHTREGQDLGTSVEVDPVLGSDSSSIDLTISLRHNYSSIETDAKGGQAKDRHYLFNTSASLSISSGATQLLGVWRLPNEPAFIQAAFVSVAVAVEPDEPPPHSRVLSLMERFGEAILPTPKVEKSKPSLPPGMMRKVFSVPPSLLATSSGEAVPDPFLDKMEARSKHTAKRLLEDAGIDFPNGASCAFRYVSGQLLVINTPENVALVEEFVATHLNRAPRQVALGAFVIQGPAAKIRDLHRHSMGQYEHSEAWETLQSLLASKEATLVDAGFVVSKPGTRCKTEAGLEYRHQAIAEKSQGAQEPKGSPPSAKTIAGFTIEADPVVSADSKTIDLTLAVEIDTAPPKVTEAGPGKPPVIEFFEHRTSTSLTLTDGKPTLVSVWKPSGSESADADVLQVLVLLPRLVVIEPLEATH